MVGRLLLAIFAVLTLCGPAFAQPVKDPDDTIKDELVVAYKILVNEGVLDSFGHVSARSAKNPRLFLMPRAMPPSLVTKADIMEFNVLDSQPVDPEGRRTNGERYIHGEIYKARPDVMSIIHSHSRAVIPLTLAGIALKPVVAQAGFLPLQSPTFESRDVVDPGSKGMQITDTKRGAALAKVLGANPVVLMRGHGDTVIGHSVREAVVYAIYVDIDARMQADALELSHNIITLNKSELFPEKDSDYNRVWEDLRQKTMTNAERATIDRSQFGLAQNQGKR